MPAADADFPSGFHVQFRENIVVYNFADIESPANTVARGELFLHLVPVGRRARYIRQLHLLQELAIEIV
jgi:hypothetical protein